ncbi:MAG: hypothetical protein CMJ59_23485 [Planctomycetaceae bacterium]|nr:hypothetical protein [Planctomycetaceae bacterium]
MNVRCFRSPSRIVVTWVTLLLWPLYRGLPAAAADVVRVRIDATTKLSINGAATVRDGLFGVDGATGGNFEEQASANMHTTSGSSAGLAGVSEDPAHPGQIDRDKLEATLAAAKPAQGGYRIDHALHCLQGGPGWQTGPQERRGYVIPQDLEVYGQWAEALVRHRLITQPQTEHYFQFFGEISLLGYWNPPESLRAPRRESSNRGGRRAAQRLIDVMTAAHRSIRGAGHNVRLGTPGLTNALQWSNWRSWRSWWEPMIDQLGDKVRFYGVHWYDMTPDMLRIEAGIVQNAQELRWNTRHPLCVQESDYTQGPMDDPLNGPYNAQYLWTLLEMPDKVVLNTSHVRDLGGEMFHNMFRADRRLPKFWSYWIMADLRGVMRSVAVSAPPTRPEIPSRRRGGRLWLFRQDRGIRAHAAGSGRQLCALIWNDSLDHERDLEVEFQLPPGAQVRQARQRHVLFDSLGEARHETQHGSGPIAFQQVGALVTVTLPAAADSIHSITLECDRELPTDRETWQTEAYGSQILFHVGGRQSTDDQVANPSPSAFQQLPRPELVIRAKLDGVRSATLRVALDKPRGDWEDTLVELNGKLYQLPVTEHVKRVALAEVPVDVGDLGDGTVKLRFLPHDGLPYRVVWSSLVTSNAPPASGPHPLVISIEDSSPQVADGHGIQAGEQRHLTCHFQNTTDHPVSGRIRWVLPLGWTLSGAAAGEISVASGERRSLTFRLQLDPHIPGVSYDQVALVVEHAAGRVIARRNYKRNTAVPCHRFAEPPSIDGDLADWTQQVPVWLPVGGKRVQVWTGWDVDHFYIAARIPQQSVTSKTLPRSLEVLQVFLDLGNEKGVYNYDANDHHFWLVTPGLTSLENATQWRLPLTSLPAGIELTDDQQRREMRWHRAYVGQTIWQGPLSKMKVPDCPFTALQCQAVEGGYVVEARIGGAWSWSSPEQAIYGYWPQVGQTIGFDFVCDDSGVSPLASARYWGRGNETLHRYYVTHPREQVRGNPACWGQLRFLP